MISITATVHNARIDISDEKLREIVADHLEGLTSSEKERWLDDVSGGEFFDLRHDLDRAEEELQTLRNTEAGVVVEPEDMNRVFSLSLCGRRADALEVLADAASERLGRRL